MNAKRENVELFVGLFLLIGFGFVAGMIIIFGSKGSQARDSYDLTVEFPNADGVIRNAQVMLSGAPIGQVNGPPVLVGTSYRVQMDLKIMNRVRIPRSAAFSISSTGRMGDKFVNVVVPAKFDPADFLAPGERVNGLVRGTGFEELTDKGAVIMEQLDAELKQIDTLTATLNQKLLSDQNMANLQETFTNLKATSDGLKAASQNINAVVEKAGATVDTAKSVMKTADGAASDLRLAIADTRKTVDAATKTIDAAKTLLKKASDGDGTLGTLINDRKMADDLKSLVANLRKSGVLFYKDRAANPAPALPPSPPPRHR